MITPALLSLRGVTKRFGSFVALNNIELDIQQGEFVALLGPSGCGKTTLLRSIAGFLKPDTGSVLIDGRDVSDLPPYRRPLNTVFQNYALFPHLTVQENVAYGPRRQGLSRHEAVARADAALTMVGLESFGARYPRQLSGGQQQRVALARAIVNRPKLLLLDEPLSAIDLKLRKRMQLELKHLQEKLGITFVFVTHDQDEAMTMADRIVVMNAGRIEQLGSGDEIYGRPHTRFVADFIGEVNLLACTIGSDGLMRLHLGDIVIPAVTAQVGKYTAVLRPEHVQVIAAEGVLPDKHAGADGVLKDVVSMGSHLMLYVQVAQTVIVARHMGMRELWLETGRSVRLALRPERLHLIAEPT